MGAVFCYDSGIATSKDRMTKKCTLCRYNEATTTAQTEFGVRSSCEKCKEHHKNLDWEYEQMELADEYFRNYRGSEG